MCQLPLEVSFHNIQYLISKISNIRDQQHIHLIYGCAKTPVDKFIVEYILNISNISNDAWEEVEAWKLRDYWEIHEIFQKWLIVMVIWSPTICSDGQIEAQEGEAFVYIVFMEVTDHHADHLLATINGINPGKSKFQVLWPCGELNFGANKRCQ